MGQILSPSAMLASQLNSVGGPLASQIEQTQSERRTGRSQREQQAAEATADESPVQTQNVTKPEA